MSSRCAIWIPDPSKPGAKPPSLKHRNTTANKQSGLKLKVRLPSAQPRATIPRFECGLCRTKYATSKSLKGHLMHTHQTSRFRCSDCPKDFSRYTDLRRHLLCSHSASKRKFACADCSFISLRKDATRRHLIRVHKYTTKVPPIREIAASTDKNNSASNNNSFNQPAGHHSPASSSRSSSPAPSLSSGSSSPSSTPSSSYSCISSPLGSSESSCSLHHTTVTPAPPNSPTTSVSDSKDLSPEQPCPPEDLTHSWTSPSVLNYLQGQVSTPEWWVSQKLPADFMEGFIPLTPGGPTPPASPFRSHAPPYAAPPSERHHHNPTPPIDAIRPIPPQAPPTDYRDNSGTSAPRAQQPPTPDISAPFLHGNYYFKNNFKVRRHNLIWLRKMNSATNALPDNLCYFPEDFSN